MHRRQVWGGGLCLCVLTLSHFFSKFDIETIDDKVKQHMKLTDNDVAYNLVSGIELIISKENKILNKQTLS